MVQLFDSFADTMIAKLENRRSWITLFREEIEYKELQPNSDLRKRIVELCIDKQTPNKKTSSGQHPAEVFLDNHKTNQKPTHNNRSNRDCRKPNYHTLLNLWRIIKIMNNQKKWFVGNYGKLGILKDKTSSKITRKK